MLNFGYIQLGRNFMDWRWYSDGNTVRLFLHLLMSVNYEDKEFQDITLRRGQRIASLAKLADELNLSVHQIRTALEHLEKTGDVTRSSQGKFTIVTVNSYDDFILPSKDGQSGGNETAEPRQASGSNEINIINNNKYNKDKKGAPDPGAEKPVAGKPADAVEPADDVKPDNSARFFNADKTANTVQPDRKKTDPDMLRRKYGEKNVREYEERLRRWMTSKGIASVADYWGTVEKWLERDNVPQLRYSDGFDPEKYLFLINNFKS